MRHFSACRRVRLLAGQALSAAPGNVLGMQSVTRWLELNGYTRASTVREPGDYAIRGGILDLFPPGLDEPVRLDFFGDTLETIRVFDPETQRTQGELRGLDLVPVAEFQLTTDTIRKFRTGYVAAFGAAARDDQLYESVSEGRRYPGMEHWLPLFHDKLDTMFDYLPESPRGARTTCRRSRARTLCPDRGLLLSPPRSAGQIRPALQAAAAGPAVSVEKEWKDGSRCPLAQVTPFAVPEGGPAAIDIGARQGHNFAAERAEPNANVFDALTQARPRIAVREQARGYRTMERRRA